MKILGIETSCDETAVSLIEAEGPFGPDFRCGVLGNALISQAALHAEYGGVFPNLAKREHAKNLVPLLEKVLTDCTSRPRTVLGQKPGLEEILVREPELLEKIIPFLETHERPDIDAIAVTVGPGLEPALWVGVNFARALSAVWNVPIVAVNHMEGHILMSAVKDGRVTSFEFPALALLISGGHTELVVAKALGEYSVVGETRDDAAGEAFDKVARLLDLPYPGGPEISRLAAESRALAVPLDKTSPWKLPRPMILEDNFDFSFSGLKTAVRRIAEGTTLSDNDKKVIAREFEEAVADVLVEKTMNAAEAYGANTILVGGGVSANTYIRERLANRMAHDGHASKLLAPAPEFATDNALMIALAGYFRALEKDFAEPDTLSANGNLRLA